MYSSHTATDSGGMRTLELLPKACLSRFFVIEIHPIPPVLQAVWVEIHLLLTILHQRQISLYFVSFISLVFSLCLGSQLSFLL